MNLDENQRKETYWVSYFGSFIIEYIPQDILYKIKTKSIAHNTFRVQSDDSIMCGFYIIDFIEYMIAGKTFLDHNNLFCRYHSQKNDNIIDKYFNDNYSKIKRKP